MIGQVRGLDLLEHIRDRNYGTRIQHVAFAAEMTTFVHRRGHIRLDPFIRILPEQIVLACCAILTSQVVPATCNSCHPIHGKTQDEHPFD